MSDTIGSRITEARDRAGLTKHALSIALDVYPATIAAWEAGRAEPRASDIVALASHLNVRPGWLLTGAR